MNFIPESVDVLLHLCFACVPGCGQMYQGYMKRGISQTIFTCAMVFVAVFLEMGTLAVLIVPLWLYSFFDSYNVRRQVRNGCPPEDDYLFGLSDMDSRRLDQILSRRGSLIGWVLIVVGLYNVYQIFARRILGALRSYFPFLDWLYSLLVWDMPRIMGTVLIIALGIWFIRGPKAPRLDEGPACAPPRDPVEPSAPWGESEERSHEEPEPQAAEPSGPQAPETSEPAPVTLTWRLGSGVENVEKEAPHDSQ